MPIVVSFVSRGAGRGARPVCAAVCACSVNRSGAGGTPVSKMVGQASVSGVVGQAKVQMRVVQDHVVVVVIFELFPRSPSLSVECVGNGFCFA